MTGPLVTPASEMAGGISAEKEDLFYLQNMDYRLCSCLLLWMFCCAPGALSAQEVHGDLIDIVYGTLPERPQQFSFTKVIHYDIIQQVQPTGGMPVQQIEGSMDLYYTPGGTSYGRVVESEDSRLVHIGDLGLGMRYTLTEIGELKIGSESPLGERMNDTITMSRVSGDREIEGRMSAHYWFEDGTVIDELWADSQASEEEVTIGRLWPKFEPGFASLANGTYEGLVTRWVAIDTKFSRDPRVTLDFKGAELLEEELVISLEGFVFPVTAADSMRERLEAERQ